MGLMGTVNVMDMRLTPMPGLHMMVLMHPAMVLGVQAVMGVARPLAMTASRREMMMMGNTTHAAARIAGDTHIVWLLLSLPTAGSASTRPGL